MVTPVSPLPTSADGGGELHRQGAEEDVVFSRAMLDDPIVGVEAVTEDEHGPGARRARPLPIPRR